jgi:molybdenum cofactor cytidylyltransferase
VITAIVLAAGVSARMGRPKLVLPVGGQSMIWRVVTNVLQSSADEVIVVVGGDATAVRGEIVALEDDAGGRLKIVENARFREGQSTSIGAGLEATDPRCQGALFVMGDQPFVGPDIIDAIIAAFSAPGALVAVPEYPDGYGAPVLFSRELFGELLAVAGDRGGKDVMRRCLESPGKQERCRIVKLSSELAARDVDTWEAFLEVSDMAVN